MESTFRLRVNYWHLNVVRFIFGHQGLQWEISVVDDYAIPCVYGFFEQIALS